MNMGAQISAQVPSFGSLGYKFRDGIVRSHDNDSMFKSMRIYHPVFHRICSFCSGDLAEKNE